MDYVPRGHEVLSALVDGGAESADEMFVDVAHHSVRDYGRMEVDAREVVADPKEDPGLVQLGNGAGELELLEDRPRVVGELGDVVLKVLARLGGTEVVEGILARVVERQARQLPKDAVQCQSGILVLLVGGPHLHAAGFQDALQPPEQCEWEDDLAELRVPEVAPQVLGVLPDEVRQHRVFDLSVSHSIPSTLDCTF